MSAVDRAAEAARWAGALYVRLVALGAPEADIARAESLWRRYERERATFEGFAAGGAP